MQPNLYRGNCTRSIMTDYGNPRLRANENNEGAYVNALMAAGHEAMSAAVVDGASHHPMRLDLDIDPADYGVSTDFGTTQDADSDQTIDSRANDLFTVVFDSLFSRFRAQGIYGELQVSAVGMFGEYTSRDTY